MESSQTAALKKTARFQTGLKIALASLIIGAAAGLSQILTIKQIVCTSRDQVCSPQTLSMLATFQGRSLFFTDVDRALSQFKPATVTRKLPHTLIINLTENDYQFYELVDFVIKETGAEKLVPDLNQKINTLVNSLTDKKIEYLRLELINQVFIVYLNDQVRVLIDENEIQAGVYRLEMILQNVDLKAVDLNIKEIDVRFKLPVLKTGWTTI